MATKEIKATSVLGVERVYQFELMDAENGTEILHEWGGKAAMSYESIIDLYNTVIGKGAGDLDKMDVMEKASVAMVIIKKLPEVLTFEVVKGLAAKMLKGYTMTEENKTYTANDRGFLNEYADPLELYTALFYAVRANYGKYIDPLLGTLDLDGSK